jgi:hypothetical protein
LTKIELPNDILSLTQQAQERMLKSVRKNNNIFKKPIKITADFSTEILKTRRAWSEVFWELNENFNPQILYPAKLPFKVDGAIKFFHD